MAESFVARPKLHVIARKRSVEEINERIAALTDQGPGSEIPAFFSLAARVARVAAEASCDIDRFPGLDMDEFREALDLWYKVSDYADVIALCCSGRSLSMAQALITLRFLESMVLKCQTSRPSNT